MTDKTYDEEVKLLKLEYPNADSDLIHKLAVRNWYESVQRGLLIILMLLSFAGGYLVHSIIT